MQFYTNQIIKMIDTLDDGFHNQNLLSRDVLVIRYIDTCFEGFPVIKVLDKNEFTWYISELQMKLVE